MSLLTCCVPGYRFYRAVEEAGPATSYYEKRSPSQHTVAVKAILERVLNAEHSVGYSSENYERIQIMMDSIPYSEATKNFKTLVDYRFEVINAALDEDPIFSVGTDDNHEKYYIAIDPNLDEKALDYLVTRELSFILNCDNFNNQLFRSISSAVTTVATIVFGWPLGGSLGTVVASDCIAGVVSSQRSEYWAHNLVVKHCTQAQLQEGFYSLQKIKAAREKGCFGSLPYLFENLRIERVKAAAGLVGKVKVL